MEIGKKLFYSLLSGILAGLSATYFLITLDYATSFRQEHPTMVWGLPLAGLLIGWFYQKYGNGTHAGHNLILEEIHDPKSITPKRLSPLVFLAALLTHLFGGSAGREGVVVQIGASLSDQLGRFFKLNPIERRNLLICGAGAGFGATMGVPIGGIFFGMEMLRRGRLQVVAFSECVVASVVAYGVTRLAHAPHSHYPLFEGPLFETKWLVLVAFAAILFGLLTRGFIFATHWVEHSQQKYIRSMALRGFIGGAALVALYLGFSLQTYEGLSIEMIHESFAHPASPLVPLIKLALTALTIGSGFKGGEFIPLVVMGCTAGSAFSVWDSSSVQVLSSAGFAAVFAAASNTPLTGSIMAAELFGWKIAPYALIACYGAYFVSGRTTIYRAQQIE